MTLYDTLNAVDLEHEKAEDLMDRGTETFVTDVPVVCADPIRLGRACYPCGKCMVCRAKRRREWVGRMHLELKSHRDAAFLTLTYDDDHVPVTTSGTQNLSLDDMQRFWKRVRAAGYKLRTFYVGEYGNRTFRPHYHAIAYGIHRREAPRLAELWGNGHIDARRVEDGCLRYVATYTIKKMTHEDDPRLKGRAPEFARMSRNPGIGMLWIPHLADFYRTDFGRAYLETTGDVQGTIQVGGKKYPLAPYYKQKLREELGIPLRQQERPHRYNLVYEPLAHEYAKALDSKMRRQSQEHGKL